MEAIVEHNRGGEREKGIGNRERKEGGEKEERERKKSVKIDNKGGNIYTRINKTNRRLRWRISLGNAYIFIH